MQDGRAELTQNELINITIEPGDDTETRINKTREGFSLFGEVFERMLPVYDGNTPYFQHLQIQGRSCYILSQNRSGHLCGYAEISDEELYHAPTYPPNSQDADPDFNVHGGITYTSKTLTGATVKEYSSIIGFDTTHSNDLPHPNSPAGIREDNFKKTHPTYESTSTYKDEQYVLNELINLTTQIDQIHIQHKCKRPGE